MPQTVAILMPGDMGHGVGQALRPVQDLRRLLSIRQRQYDTGKAGMRNANSGQRVAGCKVFIQSPDDKTTFRSDHVTGETTR